MPGFLPPQTVLVDQNPHQFRHRYRRMRVIQLKDIFFVKFTHIIMLPQIPLNGGLYRGGDEKVLLFQSQFLARDMFIIRVQHLAKLAGQILLFDGSLVVPLVKRIQLKALDRFGVPNAKCVYHTVSVTYNRQIIRNRTHNLCIFLPELHLSVFVCISGDIAAEFHFFGIFRPAKF